MAMPIYGLLAVLLAQALGSGARDWPVFVDVAEEIGVTLKNLSGDAEKDYIIEISGNGAAFFDYDGDGDLDLAIANGSTMAGYADGGDPVIALYRNDGGVYRDVTRLAGFRRSGWGMGLCVADYDNDGDSDVYLTAYGPNALFRNNGDGSFDDVTDRAGVGDAQWGANCAFGDYDRDGDVDLYVANYLEFNDQTIPRRGEGEDCVYMGMRVICGPLGTVGEPDAFYRNDGDGRFSEVGSEIGLRDPGYYGLGVVFSDFDNDGWPDIYVANDSVPNFLFHNNQDGTFSEIGLLSGASLSSGARAQAGMGLGVGDYDGNGYLDIFVTNFSRDTNTLYQNTGAMIFNDVTGVTGLGQISFPYVGWGTGMVDLDNDGFEDLFASNGHVVSDVDQLSIGESYLQRKEVYRNIGGVRFEEMASRSGDDLVIPRAARGTAFGDYDDDGDIDIVAINLDAPPNFYRNDGGSRGHWISFRLEGTVSNRDAIGARVEIDAGGRTQVREVRSGGSYLSHNDMRVHFGLGEAPGVDAVRVRWPNGGEDAFEGISADRFVVIREGVGIDPAG